MRQTWLYYFLGILLGLALPIVAFSHSSGCHGWHSCPPDKGNYVCGDTGHCSQCPNNQYCSGGQVRAVLPTPAAVEPLAPPPPSLPPSSPAEQATRVLPPPILLSPPPPPPIQSPIPAPVPVPASAPLPTPSVPPIPPDAPAPPKIQSQPVQPEQPKKFLQTESEAVPPEVITDSAIKEPGEKAAATAYAAPAQPVYLFLAASIVIGIIAAAGFLFLRP